jgi:hypothetical protein
LRAGRADLHLVWVKAAAAACASSLLRPGMAKARRVANLAGLDVHVELTEYSLNL